MALIGSGSYRDIPNVAVSSGFDAAQMDTGFGAIVDQVGGTSWQTGAPVTRPGNLDETNFSANPGFSNANKNELYSPYFINSYIRYPRVSYSGTVIYSHMIQVVPVPMLLDRMSLCWLWPSGIPVTPWSVALAVNGSTNSWVLRWDTTMAPSIYSNVTYSVSRSALEGPVQLTTGDVLSVAFRDSCPVQQMTISLACRVIHQP